MSQLFNQAFNLSVYAAIPTEETISTIISTAHRKAVNVAVEAGIVNSKTSDLVIGLAYAKMLALAGELGSDAIDDELADKLANRASSAAPVVEEAQAEEEEEEEEEEEDEAAAEESALGGLGALFGQIKLYFILFNCFKTLCLQTQEIQYMESIDYSKKKINII